MSSVKEIIVSFPGLIGDKISAAVSSIINGIGDFFATLWDWLSNILTGILGIPGHIVDLLADLLKSIFIPEPGYVEAAYSDFVNDLKLRFNLDTTVFESLFDTEKPAEDITGTFIINGLTFDNLKFVDASFLRDGVSYFRPFIRGFLVLLMFLFHVRQLIGFFGYDAGVVAGRSDDIASSRKAQRGG